MKTKPGLAAVFIRSVLISLRSAPRWALAALLATFLALGLLRGYTARMTQTFFDAAADAARGAGAQQAAVWSGVFLGAYIVAIQLCEGLNGYANDVFRRYTIGRMTADANLKTARMDPVNFENPGYLDDLEKSGLGMWYLMGVFQLVAATALQYLPQFAVLSWYLYTLKPVLVLTPLLVFLPVLAAQFLRTGVFARLEDAAAPLRRETNYYQDCMTAREYFKETRVLGAFGYFRRLYVQALTLYNRELWKASRREGLIDLVSKGLSLAGFLIILALLVQAAVRGEISAGAFAAVFAAVQAFFGMLEMLIIQRVGWITRNLAMVRNFIRYMDSPERGGEDRVVDPGEVVLEHAGFRYPAAARNAVTDVSLRIRPGETLAVVGENGSGKSTLVKLLLGLYLPTEGRVVMGGADTGRTHPRALFARTSAVFQDYARYKLTLRENIAVSDLAQTALADAPTRLLSAGDGQTTARVRRILDENGMEYGDPEIMLAKEFGGVELSGGQWQKVAIARGLFRDHALIAQDEPTAAIDPVEETRIYQRFAGISRGVTAVIVTHRLGSARIADRIAVMDGGRLVQLGTHDELCAAAGKYRDMWRAQEQWYRENKAETGGGVPAAGAPS